MRGTSFLPSSSAHVQIWNALLWYGSYTDKINRSACKTVSAVVYFVEQGCVLASQAGRAVTCSLQYHYNLITFVTAMLEWTASHWKNSFWLADTDPSNLGYIT